MNWPHTAHNIRESPRYIFTIVFLFFFNFKSSIAPLIFIFITYYCFAKKKRPIFKSKLHIYIYNNFCDFFSLILHFWKSNLYSRFLVFVINFVPSRTQSSVPIFTWERDYWLDYSLPLWTPFSPWGCLYLLPPPSLLYPILWISLCVPDSGEHLGNWLLAGSVSLLLIPPFSSWPPLSPSSLFSSLYNSVNISEWSRLWSAHKEVITG